MALQQDDPRRDHLGGAFAGRVAPGRSRFAVPVFDAFLEHRASVGALHVGAVLRLGQDAGRHSVAALPGQHLGQGQVGVHAAAGVAAGHGEPFGQVELQAFSRLASPGEQFPGRGAEARAVPGDGQFERVVSPPARSCRASLGQSLPDRTGPRRGIRGLITPA